MMYAIKWELKNYDNFDEKSAMTNFITTEIFQKGV